MVKPEHDGRDRAPKKLTAQQRRTRAAASKEFSKQLSDGDISSTRQVPTNIKLNTVIRWNAHPSTGGRGKKRLQQYAAIVTSVPSKGTYVGVELLDDNLGADAPPSSLTINSLSDGFSVADVDDLSDEQRAAWDKLKIDASGTAAPPSPPTTTSMDVLDDVPALATKRGRDQSPGIRAGDRPTPSKHDDKRQSTRPSPIKSLWSVTNFFFKSQAPIAAESEHLLPRQLNSAFDNGHMEVEPSPEPTMRSRVKRFFGALPSVSLMMGKARSKPPAAMEENASSSPPTTVETRRAALPAARRRALQRDKNLLNQVRQNISELQMHNSSQEARIASVLDAAYETQLLKEEEAERNLQLRNNQKKCDQAEANRVQEKAERRTHKGSLSEKAMQANAISVAAVGGTSTTTGLARSRREIDGVLCCTSYYQRDNPNAQVFRVRMTSQPQSDTTEDARRALIYDWDTYRNECGTENAGLPKKLQEWYSISKPTAKRLRAKQESGQLLVSNRDKCGRPVAWSTECTQEFRNVNKDGGRTLDSRSIERDMKDCGDYRTSYKGEVRFKPSKSTVGEFKTANTKSRRISCAPETKPYHRVERVTIGNYILSLPKELQVDIDEKVFTVMQEVAGELTYFAKNHKLRPSQIRKAKQQLRKRGRLGTGQRYLSDIDASSATAAGSKRADTEMDESDSDDDIRTEHQHKRHPTKQMIIVVSTCPVRTDDGRIIKGAHGKIGIFRCRLLVPAATGKRTYLMDEYGNKVINKRTGKPIPILKEDGTPAYDFHKGDPVWRNVTVDSETYSLMWDQQIAPAIDQYYTTMPDEAKAVLKERYGFVHGSGEVSGTVWAQDDGASGHGVSRKGEKLVENEVRKKLVARLKTEHSIVLFTQASQTPHSNRQDLGTLNMIDSRTQRYWREVKNALTKAEKEFVQFSILKRVYESEEMCPAMKMFNISMVKIEMLKWMVANNGADMPKDIHFGIRSKYGTYS